MYNYSINTTYLDLKDEEKQDTQYRKELLEVFMVSEYKHKTIMDSIDFCFKKYGEQTQIKLILEELIKILLVYVPVPPAPVVSPIFKSSSYPLF